MLLNMAMVEDTHLKMRIWKEHQKKEQDWNSNIYLPWKYSSWSPAADCVNCRESHTTLFLPQNTSSGDTDSFVDSVYGAALR